MHARRTCAPVLEHRSHSKVQRDTQDGHHLSEMVFIFSIPKNKETIFKMQWLSSRSLEQLNVILN